MALHQERPWPHSNTLSEFKRRTGSTWGCSIQRWESCNTKDNEKSLTESYPWRPLRHDEMQATCSWCSLLARNERKHWGDGIQVFWLLWKLDSTRKKTLMPSAISSRPWEVIVADLIDCEESMYLVVTDYFSDYIEVEELQQNTHSIA